MNTIKKRLSKFCMNNITKPFVFWFGQRFIFTDNDISQLKVKALQYITKEKYDKLHYFYVQYIIPKEMMILKLQKKLDHDLK